MFGSGVVLRENGRIDVSRWEDISSPDRVNPVF